MATKVLPAHIRIPAQERAATGGFRTANKEELGTASRDKGADLLNTLAEDPLDETGAVKKTDASKRLAPKVILTDRLGFNVFVTCTVFLNTFIIGLEQEVSDVDGGISERLLWYMIELCFASIFLVEIIMRMSALKLKFFFDVWNLLDTLIVLGAIVDALVLQPSKSGGKLRLLTTLRTMRFIRLVRLIRMFPAFRELWLLVGGLVNSIKALGWVCIILTLLVYVISVVVTTEIGQNDEVYGNGPSYDGVVWPYKEYFGTVLKSMFTLFQVMTLDGWADDVVRHILFFQPLMAILFMIFLVFSAFGLVNVVIGVIVENTLAAATVADGAIEKTASDARKKALDQLHVMLELSDSDRSGEISLAELQAAAQSHVVLKQLKLLEIKVSEIEQLFQLLDYERRGQVDLKKFIQACRELVGGAKRRDIAQVEITVGTLTQRLDSLDRKFTHVETEVACLGNLTEDFLQNTVRLLTGWDGSKPVPN